MTVPRKPQTMSGPWKVIQFALCCASGRFNERRIKPPQTPVASAAMPKISKGTRPMRLRTLPVAGFTVPMPDSKRAVRAVVNPREYNFAHSLDEGQTLDSTMLTESTTKMTQVGFLPQRLARRDPANPLSDAPGQGSAPEQTDAAAALEASEAAKGLPPHG
jgi:hypothetical protein